MLRLDDPDLGVISERMKSTQTANEDKPKSWSDLGHVGIDDFYPGIILIQPIKKPRKKKEQSKEELAEDERKYNKSISKIRIKVEHVRKTKTFFSVAKYIHQI